MRRRAPGVLVALLLALSAIACGGAQKPAGGGERARLLRLGARVFDEHCAVCHALLGRPNSHVHTDYPPGLDLDQVDPTPAYVRARIKQGGVAMGGFEGILDAREQRAVAAYVLAAGARETAVPRGTRQISLTRGRALYDEHCQRCHALAGRPPTDPNPIWVATDFDEVRPGVLWVERIVREGLRIAMPSFRDRLTLRQTRAVALYLNEAARGGDAARP